MRRKENKGYGAPRLKLGLNVDQRAKEKVILMVKAAARHVGLDPRGLEIKSVEIACKPATARKARKLASSRKPKARA